MDKKTRKLAKQGRHGDTQIAHLTPGEVVVPRSAATMARGLLSDAGIDPDRYTVSHDANSRNPRTGLLEFAENEGGAANGRGSDGPSSTGRGTGSDSGGGGDGRDHGPSTREGVGPRGRGASPGGANGNGGDASAAYGSAGGFSGTVYGRDMYGNIAKDSELGGLLGNLGVAKSPMSTQDGGWRGALGWGGKLGDTNSPSRIGFFGGFVPGTGTFSPRAVQDSYTAAQAINALGFTRDSLPSGQKVGASMFGPAGSIVGAATDAARMASGFREAGLPADQANALAGDITGRSIMGSSTASMAAGMVPGPFGMAASYAAKAATSSPFGNDKSLSEMAGFKPDRAVASKGQEKTGIRGLLDDNSYSPASLAGNDYHYAPGSVSAVAWDPVQWGNRYDPVRGLV